jgi:hypothetical protein
MTYRGSCHCGRVHFEVDADLDHVRVCDCSICRRRGALIHRVEPQFFRLLTPLDDLALYTVQHSHGERLLLPDVWNPPVQAPAHSARGLGGQPACLEGVDLDMIPIKRVYGSRLLVGTVTERRRRVVVFE